MIEARCCQTCRHWERDPCANQTTGTCSKFRIYVWPDAGSDCPEWAPCPAEETKPKVN